MISLSTIIPVYSDTRYLEAAIKSAQKATSFENQVIVVDDGNEAAVSQRISKICQDLECELVVNATNRGLPASRNAGLAKATGSFLRFLDADDLICPEAVNTKTLMALSAPNSPDILISRWSYCDDQGIPNNSGVKNAYFESSKALTNLLFEWEKTLTIPIHSAIFSRNFLFRHNLHFNETVRAKEDWIFWVDTAIAGARFEFLSEVTALYRMHDTNMCLNHKQMGMAYLKAAFAIARKLDSTNLDTASNFVDSVLKHFQNVYFPGESTQSQTQLKFLFAARKIESFKKIFK